MRVQPIFLVALLALTACGEETRMLVREANLPTIAPQRQKELSGARSWEVRRALAGNRHTAPALLLRLARDPEPRVRIAVATNLGSPEEARRALARDPLTEVRSVVARFEYVSAQTLEILSHDEDAEIRFEVAANWNTDEATLKRLSQDSYESVAGRARQELEKRAIKR